MQRGEHVATGLHAAPYGVYKIADCHVVLSLGPNASKLADVLDSEELRALGDGARTEQRDAYANIVAKLIREMSWADLDAALQPHGIWYERVAANFDEVRDDAQVQASEGLQTFDVGGRVATLTRHPVRYDGEMCGFRFFAAEPGAHSVEVLRDADFSEARIEGLLKSGVIAVGSAS